HEQLLEIAPAGPGPARDGTWDTGFLPTRGARREERPGPDAVAVPGPRREEVWGAPDADDQLDRARRRAHRTLALRERRPAADAAGHRLRHPHARPLAAPPARRHRAAVAGLLPRSPAGAHLRRTDDPSTQGIPAPRRGPAVPCTSRVAG